MNKYYRSNRKGALQMESKARENRRIYNRPDKAKAAQIRYWKKQGEKLMEGKNE